MKLITIIAVLLAVPVSAAEIELEWDAHPEPRVAGYYLDATDLFGSRTTVDVGLATRATILVKDGLTYHFTVRAYELVGAEKLASADSPALVETMPGPLPPLPAAPRKVIEIQSSVDLKSWETVAWLPVAKQETEFVRAKITTLP